jgi:hypothetical protein
MFSPEQEMILGELTVQQLASEFRQVNDPGLTAYINELGAKLIKHLPPTGLTFTFHIIEYPEANAFNIPGGHVFISRKLIALANSEDELASVIAHELGHASVHHGAVDMSEAMRRVLKVNAVGNRSDIIEKYNLLIENATDTTVSAASRSRRRPAARGRQHRVLCDGRGGLRSRRDLHFFDRLTESEGKTGSWFSELFGARDRNRNVCARSRMLRPSCRPHVATDAWQKQPTIF